MILRNSIALTGAVCAGITIPATVLSLLMGMSPHIGAAAFTTSLCTVGGTLMGGLLGLMVLSIFITITAYILIQMQLAWLPV